MPRIRLLETSGTPYAMGTQHGQAYADSIRELTEERLQLSSEETWTGSSLSRYEVMALADLCLMPHYDYAPDLMEELQGTADATGLDIRALIIANGFTDFVDVVAASGSLEPLRVRAGSDCTAFLVNNEAAAGGRGFLGQTWDMHASATPYVILMRGRPAHAPAFLVFTITGCVGMIGMNDAGISVGINNLLGAGGQPGVTWPFVVRKILQQTTLEDALACITSAKLAGAHNYMIMDRHGRGYNVEAMTTAIHITPLDAAPLTHANQCLYHATRTAQRPLSEDWVLDSELRVARSAELLKQGKVTPRTLMAMTRDRAHGDYSICALPEAPYYSETCGAAIMRPATGEFWGVWGLPTENAYEKFHV